MTVQLDLLRHGETEQGGGLRGSIDDALTATGWTQLREALATTLSEQQGQPLWDRVISSPLQRCARFAEEVAQAQGIPLSFDAALQELHFGDWEGLSSAEVMQRDAQGLGQFWADPYAFTPPNAEPLLQFEARILASVQRMQQAHCGERILLLTHGGVMRLLLARARGLPRSDLMQVSVGHAQLVRLAVEPDGTLGERR
ncbi:alpha-ribazole phosphatase family protein [Pseudomonas sp. RL_15y_Pfl2_60]|uniref:alpha-ribazole phosphatase family protein n=1 Tax=Pseudomonas sp. RL_15y_Pfl2_60 TaxID=3088709 RepID=UPI0030DB621C